MLRTIWTVADGTPVTIDSVDALAAVRNSPDVYTDVDPNPATGKRVGLGVIGPFAIGTRHYVECLTESIDVSVSAADFLWTSDAVSRVVVLTQAAYDDLEAPVATTLYLIVG